MAPAAGGRIDAAVCYPQRNDHSLAFVQQRLYQPRRRITRHASKEGQHCHVIEQNIGDLQTLRLPGCEKQACRFAQGIDSRVDRGAQSTPDVPEGLSFAFNYKKKWMA